MIRILEDVRDPSDSRAHIHMSRIFDIIFEIFELKPDALSTKFCIFAKLVWCLALQLIQLRRPKELFCYANTASLSILPKALSPNSSAAQRHGLYLVW